MDRSSAIAFVVEQSRIADGERWQNNEDTLVGALEALGVEAEEVAAAYDAR